MPKKAVNYSNSCVYKICCNDINIKDCYVGSTTNLYKRRIQHKGGCYNEKHKSYNYNVYKFIRDNGGWGNWTVVLVESYTECKSREELFRFERYHMEKLEATLNRQVPGRPIKEYRKEYYQNNFEKIKENHKEYYQNNSEKIKENHKEYYQNNSEKIKKYEKEYYQNNSEKKKEYDKEYYQNNSEKKKEYEKEYRRNNSEKISESRKEKVECEFCHSVVQKNSMYRHHKSKKCLATQ
jgi:hypothetical protein